MLLNKVSLPPKLKTITSRKLDRRLRGDNEVGDLRFANIKFTMG